MIYAGSGIYSLGTQEGCSVDDKLLGYIRRVNLDMLWIRESGTVASNLITYNKSLAATKHLGIQPSYEAPGPWGINDDVGFGCALEIIRASQLSGKNKTTYQQFDTVKKIQTVHYNFLSRQVGRQI